MALLMQVFASVIFNLSCIFECPINCCRVVRPYGVKQMHCACTSRYARDACAYPVLNFCPSKGNQMIPNGLKHLQWEKIFTFSLFCF